MAANPLGALQVADQWVPLLAAYRWLEQSRGSGRYLREITAPGVDTKFVERHRELLARLLGVDRRPAAFVTGSRPARQARHGAVAVRYRRSGIPVPLSEGTFRVEELASLPASVETAMIIENETTYLTVPIPVKGVVLWGKGFEVDRAGSLPGLRDAVVHYWGDLDSLSFAVCWSVVTGVRAGGRGDPTDAVELAIDHPAEHHDPVAAGQAAGLGPVGLGWQRLEVVEGVGDLDRHLTAVPAQPGDPVRAFHQPGRHPQRPPQLVLHPQHIAASAAGRRSVDHRGTRHPGRGKYLIKSGERVGLPVARGRR